MSFVFPSWETAFSPAFHESAKAMLEGALNKGNKPPVIQGRIEVVELSMGTVPPTLTLLEIGDLSMDRFRGILRLGYAGDAWLEVRCRVQANPLSHNPHLAPSSTLPLSTPLLASQPLLVPMTLRLSKLHLRAILILVVSQSKGITLVFKNDPLQNVDVSSTFDSIEVIRGYLQQEIEGQLREMFREDLPGIIHRLSQQWFAGAGTGGRVEMPYRDREEGAASIAGQTDQEDTEEDDSPFSTKPLFPPHPSSTSTSGLSSSPNRPTTPRRRSMVNQTSQPSFRNRRSSNPAAPPISSSPSAYTTFPDIEDYDPTYGLRPEGVPTHSGYEAFGRLWEKAREGGRGLGSLMREPIGEGALLEEDEDEMEHMEQDDWAPSRHEGDVSDLEDDLFTSNAHGRSGDVDDELDAEAASVDVVDPRLLLRRMDSRRSTQSGIDALSRNGAGYVHGHGPEDEFDTFPAVGGGFITRPRVYHAQSQIVIRGPGGTPASAASDVGAANSPAGTAGTGSVTARAASSVAGASSTIGSLRQITPQRRPMGSSASVGNGLAGFSGATPGPGPTTLRRMTTSRSDVFLSRTAQGPGIASPSPARRGPSASVSYASFNPLLAHAINGRMSQQNGGPSRRQSAAAQSRSRPRPTSVHANIPSGPMYGSSGARMVMSPPGSSYRSGHAGAAQPANRSSRSGTYSTVGSNSHSHPQSYSQMPSSRSMSIPTPSSDIGRSPSKQSAIGGGRQRASSVANGFTGLGGSPSSFPPRQSLQAGLAGITLPPLNNSVSQLATLSHSAQTLSPYARAHEHVAVRSFPYGLQHASLAGAGPGSGSGTGTGSGSAVGVGRGNVGLGMVMGSDLSGPTYGNGQSAGSVSGKGDGRVGRVLGRAGAMVYASQVQRERYEERKAAYANGGDAVKGVRKRYYDFSKRGKADTQAGTADGVQSRRSSPGELDEGDMARLSIKPEGRMGQAAGSAKTPGAELARPKIRERVSYGFPKV